MTEYVGTIGFFDGVHCGHRFVIDELKKVAAEQDLAAAVITFERHPRSILQADYIPQLLTTFDERVARLKASNVDEIFAFNFELVKDMTAEEFMHILYENCGVKVLLMGYDHHFGCDHLRDFADYQKAAERVGLKIAQLPQFAPVSSTIIRNKLLSGEVENANKLLGYPYSLTGIVTEGKHIGQQIGFPTANIVLNSQEKLVPKEGVYEVSVRLQNADYKGVLNVGTNPTVNGENQTLEVHILDFTRDIYGESLTISLLRYLRTDRKFESLEALKEQIKLDILQIKERR